MANGYKNKRTRAKYEHGQGQQWNTWATNGLGKPIDMGNKWAGATNGQGQQMSESKIWARATTGQRQKMVKTSDLAREMTGT